MSRHAFRRLVACLVTLCLGLFQAESLIADVCDGDAAAAEVAAFAGAASDLASHAPRATGSVAADAVAGGAEAPVLTAATDGQEDGSGPAGHETHACHCVHAHGGMLSRPAAASPTAALVVFGALPRTSERTPASVAPEPPLRPPAV